jgi:hypothetical protein
VGLVWGLSPVRIALPTPHSHHRRPYGEPGTCAAHLMATGSAAHQYSWRSHRRSGPVCSLPIGTASGACMPEAGASGTCHAMPFASPHTNHTIWSHQHAPGHRAAPPCGAWPCQATDQQPGHAPLCNVMQHPCSDYHETTTRCHVLSRRGVSGCPFVQSLNHRCAHRCPFMPVQHCSNVPL